MGSGLYNATEGVRKQEEAMISRGEEQWRQEQRNSSSF